MALGQPTRTSSGASGDIVVNGLRDTAQAHYFSNIDWWQVQLPNADTDVIEVIITVLGENSSNII